MERNEVSKEINHCAGLVAIGSICIGHDIHMGAHGLEGGSGSKVEESIPPRSQKMKNIPEEGREGGRKINKGEKYQRRPEITASTHRLPPSRP